METKPFSKIKVMDGEILDSAAWVDPVDEELVWAVCAGEMELVLYQVRPETYSSESPYEMILMAKISPLL